MVDAVKKGPEATVAWAQTLLVYGPVSLAPSHEALINEREELVKAFARRQNIRGGYLQEADLSALFRMVSLSECVSILGDCMSRNNGGEAQTDLNVIWKSLHDLQDCYEKRVIENGMTGYCIGTDFRRIYCKSTDETIAEQVVSQNQAAEKKISALKCHTGLLLPLRCGHNAPLKHDEAAQFDGVLSDLEWYPINM